MHTEIEVKAILTDLLVVKKKLESMGCVFSEPVTQDDMVYGAKVGSLEDFLSNDVFLRIRIQGDGKVVLTAKKPRNKSADSLIKQEHEVIVSSADEARGILDPRPLGAARLRSRSGRGIRRWRSTPSAPLQ